MTKQEIKEAIAKGIAGQGTNVDGGGYLPKILEAIVDAIPEGGAVAPEPTITTIVMGTSFENVDESQAAETLGITVDELKALPNQLVVKTTDGDILTRIFYTNSEGNYIVIFGGQDINTTAGRSIYLNQSKDIYTAKISEV